MSTPIVALREARISVQPLWGFSSSNPHHSQSRAEHVSKLPTKESSEKEVKEAVKTMFMSHKIPNYGSESGDIATWEGDPQLKHKPKTENGVLTLRLQENRKFEKNEIQKIDLKVRVK